METCVIYPFSLHHQGECWDWTTQKTHSSDLWMQAGMEAHTCAQSTATHTLLGSERWDWRAGERRDRSRGYFFSRARFNFNALICEIMAADCNIVISRRIKRRNRERRANSAFLRASRQTQGREEVAQRGGGRAMGKVEAERREEGSAARWQPIVAAGYKYSRDDRVDEGMEEERRQGGMIERAWRRMWKRGKSERKEKKKKR